MKPPVVVAIDTSKTNETMVMLLIGKEKKEKHIVSDLHTSQKVLPLLFELLSQNGLSFQDITDITVHPGPGSFTGLRVGAAIASTLGWLLNVPVNGQSNGVLHLEYGADHWGNDSH